MQSLSGSATTMIQVVDAAAAAARMRAAAVASQDAVASLSPNHDRPQPGDIVTLGCRAPEEYRGAPAVVTAVAETHCTVVVLDESKRFGIGECWPSFQDLHIECRQLRIGSEVCIGGMQASKTKKLNGFSGKIRKHKREGHPFFIQKPSMPDTPQLCVCVRLDEPEMAGERVVMLEPRFLQSLSGMQTESGGPKLDSPTQIACETETTPEADHSLATDMQQESYLENLWRRVGNVVHELLSWD